MRTNFTYQQFLSIHGYPPGKVIQILNKKKYLRFFIRKSNGKKRHIEAPSKRLKKLQREINQLLQNQYMQVLPACSHGYISAHPDVVPTRGIRTNASAHLDKSHLLNIDMQDFFHSITLPLIQKALTWLPIHLDAALCDFIVDVATLDGRLPMGAPTSPVLSNICSIALDRQIENYCQQHLITYTRYVDDMSFSANFPLWEEHESTIIQMIQEYGFPINPIKRKQYPPIYPKVVTGLEIENNEIQVSESFEEGIRFAIEEYEKICWLHDATDGTMPALKAKKKHYQQVIAGQLNFIEQMEGASSPDYQSLKAAYEQTKMRRGKERFDFYLNDFLE